MAFKTGLSAPRPQALPRHVARAQPNRPEAAVDVERRTVLTALATGVISTAALPALASPQVGSYLPSAGIDDLVLFVPSATKTPAIRAGTVNPQKPYRFAVPPSWTERKVSNSQSGNYCQPRCGEAWTEVIFVDDAQGSIKVIACPLIKLTNEAGARIQDIGTPETFLESVGPFITGTYLEPEDVISTEVKELEDGNTYYTYNINASYGLTGPHTVTVATVKGECALLFLVSATDKQWAKHSKLLKQVATTFRA